MRLFLPVIATFVVAITNPSRVLAQRRPGPPINSQGPGGLWMNKGLQEELKLEPGQIDRIKAIQTLARTKIDAIDAADKLAPPEKRTLPNFASTRKQAISKEIQESINAVVKPAQIKRFNQIVTRELGFAAFSRPPIQDQLHLTDVQKNVLETIKADYLRRWSEIDRNLKYETRDLISKEQATLHDKTMEAAIALFTPPQQAIWKEMIGKPFKVKYDNH